MSELKAFAMAISEHLSGWVFDVAYWENDQQHFARLVNAEFAGAQIYVQCARRRAEISGGILMGSRGDMKIAFTSRWIWGGKPPL